MNFTDYMIWKLIALGLLAFFGNFFYTLLTGKNLGEVLRDREEAQRNRPNSK